jgi:ABC-2 type transport system permease protein/sodium transport system permease protein
MRGRDRNSLPARIARLTRKELRETLRDRRTIVTLFVMPLLVYPLLSMAFQRYVLVSMPAPSEKPAFRLGFSNAEDAQLFFSYLSIGHGIANPSDELQGAQKSPRSHQFSLPEIDLFVDENPADSVAAREVDLGVRVRRRGPLDLPTPANAAIDVQLLYDPHTVSSREALELIERRLALVNEQFLKLRLKRAGATGRLTPIDATRVDVGAGSPQPSFPLATLVPFVLILTTITGAVYPAIDLTAGERERGTLEMLVAAPVPKLGLLFAKYVAVVTVAMLTAVVNVSAMTITVASIGLTDQLFGERGLTAELAIEFLGLLLLFAAFFSAVLLALTSFARSFKEAQAYLVPLMLAATAPGIFTVVGGVRLSLLLAVTPLANIVLLSRDMFEYNADPLLALLVLCSTLIYAAIALAIAAKLFGSDAVLYGSPGGWSEALHRPAEARKAPSLGIGLLTLIAVSPAFMLCSNLLGQFSSMGIGWRLGWSALATICLFGLPPIVVEKWAGVGLIEGLQLRVPSWLAFAAAVILGASLWPFAHEIVVRQHEHGWITLDPDKLQRVQDVLTEFRQVSPAWLVLCTALVPAICEELFFRGFLLSSLRLRQTNRMAIFTSAAIFGAFHVIVTNGFLFERFLPTTFLGLLLGWLAIQTRSIYPGMLLHAVHNGLLLLMAYYQPELSSHGWGIEAATHLPTNWLIAAVAGSIAGVVLALKARPANT